MTISQEPLVELHTTLCQNVSYIKPFDFLQFGIPRWPPFAVIKGSVEHENDNLNNRFIDFEQICVKTILATVFQNE